MKRKAIIVTLAVIAVIAGAVLLKGHEMLVHASQTLAEDLSDELGSKITIGKVELNSLYTLTIDDIAVYDARTERLLTSPKVEVNYSLIALIRGNPVMEAISKITVKTPSVIVRQDNSGNWNYTELLQNKTQSQSHFTGKIAIENGNLLLGMNDNEWQFDAINGAVDFANQPAAKIQFSGERQGAKFRAEGRVDSQGLTSLALCADEIVVRDYQALYPENNDLHITDGKLKKVSLTIQKRQGETVLAGETRLDGVEADIDSVKVQDIQGFITFTNKSIYFFDTAAKIYQQPVKVRGKVALDSTVPALKLYVSSPGFDLDALNADFPVHGTVSGEAQVLGLANNPLIDGEFSLSGGEAQGYKIPQAKAKLHISDRQIFFKDVEATMLGGTISAQGMYDFATKKYTLSCAGKNIRSSEIAELSPYLSGTGQFAVEVQGQGPFSGAAVKGTAMVEAGSLQGIPFTELHAGFMKLDDRFTIDYLNISAGGGEAAASGWLTTDGTLSINLWAHGLTPALFESVTGKLPLDGQFDFSGKAAGAITQPEISGQFTAMNGEICTQPFKKAEGAIYLKGNDLSLQNVLVADGAASHFVQGKISLAGEPEINISVLTKSARAENLIKLFSSDEKLTGNVDNEVVLSGPLKNYNVQGHVVLTDGSYRGQLLTKAEGYYERQNGDVTLRDFVVSSLSGNALIAGQISKNDELSLEFAARNVDLSKLQAHMPYPISGKADFVGRVAGSIDYPEFTGQLSAQHLTFNGKEIQSVLGLVSGHGNQIDISQFDFVQENGKFYFSGGVNLASREISGQLDVEGGKLEFLLAAFNLPAKDISGSLNGRMNLSGSTKRPDIWLKGQLIEGQIKKYPLHNTEVDLELVNNILTINKFTAQQGQGILAATGTADLQGALNLEIDGRDIDAGLLSAWFNPKIEAKGRLSFAAQVGGTVENPHTAVSLDIAGGGVSTATFDSLYGLLVIDKDIVRINQLLLTKGPYRASAYGTVPLVETGRDSDDQINLIVKLDEADLSILPMLTKDVAWARGHTQGGITINGTLRQPSMHGEFKVNDGMIKLAYLNDPIQKVGVDIELDDDKINIKTFQGSMGQGSYKLSGTASLKGLELRNYDMVLTLDKLGINSKYFKGPVNGELTLKEQKNGRPLLAGNVLFDQDLVNIPIFPTLSESNFDADLNVDVVVGRKVHFYNAFLYDLYAAGKLHFTGSTKKPTASGHIRALRGTVSYLRTPFKINQGRLEFAQFADFEPVIKLKAEAKLEQTVVDLDISGPMSNLDFKLKSDPPMRHQEILSLLTLRSRFFENQKNGSPMNYSGLGREEAMSFLDAGLQMTFVSEVEGLFRSTLGLDEFQVRRNLFDEDSATNINAQKKEGYTVEVGKYLNDKLMFTHLMGLDHYEYKTSLRYDFSRRISVIGSIDYRNNKYIGIETRYRF